MLGGGGSLMTETEFARTDSTLIKTKQLICFQVHSGFKALMANHKILWEQLCCFSISTQANIVINLFDCKEQSSPVGLFWVKRKKVA